MTGQGQWNGVAILSKVGLDQVVANFDSSTGDADLRRADYHRDAAVRVSQRLRAQRAHARQRPLPVQARVACPPADAIARGRPADEQLVVAGDFNIDPDHRDVYDPAKFVGATHVSPPERRRARRAGRLGPDRHVPAARPEHDALQLVGLPRTSTKVAAAAHRPADGHPSVAQRAHLATVDRQHARASCRRTMRRSSITWPIDGAAVRSGAARRHRRRAVSAGGRHPAGHRRTDLVHGHRRCVPGRVRGPVEQAAAVLANARTGASTWVPRPRWPNTRTATSSTTARSSDG